MNKNTDPRPPPYNPGRVGQFMQREQDKAGGVITGRITITVNKEEEEEEEETGDRSPTHKKTGASSSSRHHSGDKPLRQGDTGDSSSQQHADKETYKKATHQAHKGACGEADSGSWKDSTRREEDRQQVMLDKLIKDKEGSEHSSSS